MPVNEVRPYGDSDQARDRSRGPDSVPEGQGEDRTARSTAYDPSAVQEWARSSIARTAREHSENTPGQMSHVAEIEAARRYAAEHPAPPPPPLNNSRDFLHLAAIEAWQAIASGKPVPRIDPVVLCQEMCEAFETSDGGNLVGQVHGTWLELARQHGITAADENGDLLPGLDSAITGTIITAIWFGITTGYLTLAGSYRIPRRFLV